MILGKTLADYVSLIGILPVAFKVTITSSCDGKRGECVRYSCPI